MRGLAAVTASSHLSGDATKVSLCRSFSYHFAARLSASLPHPTLSPTAQSLGADQLAVAPLDTEPHRARHACTVAAGLNPLQQVEDGV